MPGTTTKFSTAPHHLHVTVVTTTITSSATMCRPSRSRRTVACLKRVEDLRVRPVRTVVDVTYVHE